MNSKMEIAENIKTILCDSVRQEIGNKMSLIGIYSKDLVVTRIPAIIPIINLVIMLEKIKEPFKEIYIKLITPENETKKIKYAAPRNLEKGRDINIVIGVSPFKVNGQGIARFEMRLAEDDKPFTVHEFNIKEAEMMH